MFNFPFSLTAWALYFQMINAPSAHTGKLGDTATTKTKAKSDEDKEIEDMLAQLKA